MAFGTLKGRNRDTAWFRMLDRDWLAARRALEERIVQGRSEQK